jgi:formiminotetrahydrofolate cyclodeaminase
VGAAAAAVLNAVAREAGDGALAAQAQALVTRLERLAEADGKALGAARAALSSAAPETSDDRRDFALGRALDQAAAMPLEIAEACADVTALAHSLARLAEPASIADVDAAGFLAAGAAKAAAHLVETNLGVLAGDERAIRARAAAASAANPA